MPNIEKDKFIQDSEKVGTKINPVPVPETEIGVDTANEFFKDIANLGESASIDISSLNTFTQLSQNRETLYQVLDTMAQDSTVAAILEIYAEDATETNERGEIVWSESSDPNINKYITYLLKSLNVDKNMYKWVYSLCKYGDLYLKLFRHSDFEDKLFEDSTSKSTLNEKFSRIADKEPQNEAVNESILLKAYDSEDRLANFIDMVPNPGEMFELTKFGKSYAYLKTNQLPTAVQQQNPVISSYYLYKMRKRDLEIYNAVSFVHATLCDDTPRMPEQVQIFYDNDLESDNSYTYKVNKGQSILYSSYKIWREMMLLENALLLNRLTKSSILRVIEVEVADMPKERVQPYLQRVKTLVEQKTSISDGDRLTEYTNPGPMENNVYVPTRNGVGALNTQQIGGDINVKDIADIDYFKNKFYGSMKIPKQYLGDTDDATGFNGGTSLSIVSSRYAKTVKRIQSAMIQALTDCINILLIDRGLDSYVNKFTLHMQPPVTQEEIDKRDNLSSEIDIVRNILDMTSDIEDPVTKLKILKTLLSQTISNQEVIELVQDEIERLEQEVDEGTADNGELDDELGDMDFGGGNLGGGFDDFGTDFEPDNNDFEEVGPGADLDTEGEDLLPTPDEAGTGLDFTSM